MKKAINFIRKIAKWGKYGMAFVDILIYAGDRLEKVSKDKTLKLSEDGKEEEKA